MRNGARRLGLILLMGLLLVACNRSTPSPTQMPPTATTTATAAAETVANALPTLTREASAPTPPANGTPAGLTPGSTPGLAIGIASQGAIFTSPRYSYTVVLPCCWLALPTPGTAIESALAELEEGSELPIWGDLGERVHERESGAVLELIALLPDAENGTLPVAQMTVSVLPTHGLTLDGYLAATAAELNGIANTQVVTATIEAALGVGAFPASVIEYTAAPTPVTGNSAQQSMAGLQVAFFGNDANSLIVLSFTTTVERFAELQPEFLQIVRSVTLNEPTA